MMGNKLIINDKYIEIVIDDKASLELINQIPYVHFNRSRTKFRTTTRNIDLVLKVFRGIDMWSVDTLPKAVRDIYDREMIRRIDTKTLLELGPQRDRQWLFRHQQLGVELSEINDRFAFFYDTRTGKTPMSLKIIADDIAKNPDHKWLVLCPLILIENAWLEDAHTFFQDIKVVNLHDKTKAKRLEKFKQSANLYLTNIESFTSYEEEVRALGIYGCFVDESSAMKSHSSKFAKAAVAYAQECKKWYLLSGTPAPNGEWEYYRQLQSVDYYGVHQSYSQFKEYFFNNVSYNPQYEKLRVKSEKEAEINALLKRYSLYVDKEDVLTTPGRKFIELNIPVPDDVMKQYKHLQKELYLDVQKNDGSNTSIIAPSAAAKINKLNQVSSGFIIDSETQDTYLLSMFKFNYLQQLLSTLGNEQAIIWCHYRKEFEIIKQILGDKCSCVYGGVNLEDKNKNIKDFKEGRVQYLIANPASADKGLTLTNACYAIYFSMGYSYELWKQSIERIYGDIIKQKRECTYYILIADKTVDKVIFDAVQSKGDMSTAVLNHLKGGL